MKISGCTIRKKFIQEHTEEDFLAIYKGHEISITTDHGFGEPDDHDLKRFNIDVEDLNADSFSICVQSYQDFETIEEAIDYALKGAMLVPQKTK